MAWPSDVEHIIGIDALTEILRLIELGVKIRITEYEKDIILNMMSRQLQCSKWPESVSKFVLDKLTEMGCYSFPDTP